MCYSKSIDKLLSFGLSNLRKILKDGGLSLGKIDEILKKPGDYVEIPSVSWNYTGQTTKLAEVSMYLRKDSEGLFLELRYYHSLKGDICSRFYLVKKESNLKPGTYRYYILDPYQERDSLCSKIYLLPERGVFVTRSVLTEKKALYSIQRKGHTDRSLFGIKVPETRYRKSHYRGRVTPFWDRYERLNEKQWENYVLFSLRKKLISPGEIAPLLTH